MVPGATPPALPAIVPSSGAESCCMSAAYGIVLVCSGGKMIVFVLYHEGRMNEIAPSSTALARPLRRMNFRHWIRVLKKNSIRGLNYFSTARGVTFTSATAATGSRRCDEKAWGAGLLRVLSAFSQTTWRLPAT